MTCDRCGQPLTTGEHGVGCCPLERGRHRKSTVDVTWPGGRTFENLGHEPLTFYAPSELQRHLRTHHLEPFVRHVPVPGSDKSPHTTSWSAISREALDGATAMLERVGKGTDAAPPSWVQSMTVEVSTVIEPVRGRL